HGVAPLRVCQYELNKDQTEILKMDFIVKGTPNLGEPTLGVKAGNEFYFIANSPWGAYEKGVFNSQKAAKPLIMKWVF
ncbi:hypothetical protein L0244_32135, partial [bacterium]|nr:hypothetical protein [bacterium]